MRKIGGYLKPWTAAQYLGIPLEEVEKMLESGELPGVVIGGQWRVPIDQLERWLDEEVPPEELKKLAGHLKDVDEKKLSEFFEGVEKSEKPQAEAKKERTQAKKSKTKKKKKS